MLNLSRTAIAFSTACILFLIAFPKPLRTLAQTFPSQTPEVMPPLEPDDKPPTLPAGPRDPCLKGENSQSLIPLLPDLNQKIGLTVSPHPTIFVYIPQTRAETAQFVLITPFSRYPHPGGKAARPLQFFRDRPNRRSTATGSTSLVEFKT